MKDRQDSTNETKEQGIKLTKTSTRVAMSLIPRDIIFYRDTNNNNYRLTKIPLVSDAEEEAFIKAINLSKHAPNIIEGILMKETTNEVYIFVNKDNLHGATAGIYELQKNAENYNFWDITDKIAQGVGRGVL